MSATASAPNRPNIVIMVAGGILVALVAIVYRGHRQFDRTDALATESAASVIAYLDIVYAG